MRIPSREIRSIVRRALREDAAFSDITTQVTLGDGDYCCTNTIAAKQPGTIAGIDIAAAVFRTVDKSLSFNAEVQDGQSVDPGTVLAQLTGQAQSMLRAERVALNLLQRMSGIATLTAQYVAAVSHTDAIIADTRKTAPGLRSLDKYSVRAGGGVNHRSDLRDGVLIKDNHLAAMMGGGQTLAQVVTNARNSVPLTMKVEVEVESVNDALMAIAAGADIVMLDNMDPDQMRQVVVGNGGNAKLEASGGVTLHTVAAIAETGVDIISVGELTHSPKALDIGMDLAYA